MNFSSFKDSVSSLQLLSLHLTLAAIMLLTPGTSMDPADLEVPASLCIHQTDLCMYHLVPDRDLSPAFFGEMPSSLRSLFAVLLDLCTVCQLTGIFHSVLQRTTKRRKNLTSSGQSVGYVVFYFIVESVDSFDKMSAVLARDHSVTLFHVMPVLYYDYGTLPLFTR